MLYDKSRELYIQTLEHWKSSEVFSFGWFLMVGVLVIAYVLWGVTGNRFRSVQLLLIGSLAAIAYSMNSIVTGTGLGLIDYQIRIFPTSPALFISSITLAPIIIMLVEQAVSTWKGYLLWSGLGFAFLDFVIFPMYTAAGILTWHHWNVFYNFFVLYGISIGVRFVYLLIQGVEGRAAAYRMPQ